jgi:hypothetical protein
LAILAAVGHLKFRLDKAQQLSLAGFAIVFAAGVLSEMLLKGYGPSGLPGPGKA